MHGVYNEVSSVCRVDGRNNEICSWNARCIIICIFCRILFHFYLNIQHCQYLIPPSLIHAIDLCFDIGESACECVVCKQPHRTESIKRIYICIYIYYMYVQVHLFSNDSKWIAAEQFASRNRRRPINKPTHIHIY